MPNAKPIASGSPVANITERNINVPTNSQIIFLTFYIIGKYFLKIEIFKKKYIYQL